MLECNKIEGKKSSSLQTRTRVGNFGPVEVEVNINPVVAGAQGAIIAGQAAKQAIGKAPPTPIISLFNSIFGIGK